MNKKGKLNYNEIVFSNDELEYIKREYINGISSTKIGKALNVSHKVILKALRRMNVDINQSRSSRKYNVESDYFDIIDTQNKAYILGLLFADGNNCISKGNIRIALQEDDVEILEKIRKEMHYEKELTYIDYSNKNDFGYTYKNQYKIDIYSTHMCKSLEKVGMIPNKSLILRFPDIDKSLYRHFIRGYYDGDGSICRQIKSVNNHSINITITSTLLFCEKVSDILKKELNINSHVYDASCHNGVTKVLAITGRNNCKHFLDWIYEDSKMYLQRKYNRYCEYYNVYNPFIA